jgi:hypothetical protein
MVFSILGNLDVLLCRDRGARLRVLREAYSLYCIGLRWRAYRRQQRKRKKTKSCPLCSKTLGRQIRGFHHKCFRRLACRYLPHEHSLRRAYYPQHRNKPTHRRVAEIWLGRSLRPGEIVHHINHVTWDFAPANLAVFPNESYHRRLHRGQMGREELLQYWLPALTDDATRLRRWLVRNCHL